MRSLNGVRTKSTSLSRRQVRPLQTTPLRLLTIRMSVSYMNWTMVNRERWAPWCSAELVTSEEESEEVEHDSDSEERDGYPNIQRVMTYPARLTEDGGIERIGPTEVISEADPTWNQWDQDHWCAHRSDSDYKERVCVSTATLISLPVSVKHSWEWRGSCCLVRVHRQARRCLFTPTWKEDIWHGFKVHPTRKTYVTPVGQKKHLNPVIENVKHCSSLKPWRVAYPWIGETHFKVDPDMCGKRVFRMSARILVPANDMNPVAIADSGASHVILPTSALPDKQAGKPVTLRLAAGQVRAVEHQREVFADYVTVPFALSVESFTNWDSRLYGHL